MADIIAGKVHQGKRQEAAQSRIGLGVHLSLTAADAQLSGYRAVEPRIRNPGVSAAQRPAEVAAAHRLGHGNEDGHILWFASRHAGIDRHMPSRGGAISSWQYGDGLVPRMVGII